MELGEIVEAVNDIAGVPVAPEKDRQRLWSGKVPPEESVAIRGTKPDVF